MFYEIPREVFKQKLLDRTNVCFIQLGASENQVVPFKDIVAMAGPLDVDGFSKKNSNKNMTYVFYGFDQFGVEAKKAAEAVSTSGYPFVYFYQGSLAHDQVLDKGIN